MKIGKKVCAIEFNENFLRIVEGRTKDLKVTVNKKAEYPMKEGLFDNGEIINMDGMVSFLQDALKSERFSAKRATVVLSSDKILLSEFSIPFVSDAEIKTVVDFKAQEILRESMELYVSDYLILKKIMEDGAERLRVLLISVPKEIVVSYIVLLNRVGLEPYTFDFKPSAISKYIYSLESLGSYDKLTDKSIAIINSDGKSIVLSIMRNGVLEMNKAINFDLLEITNGIRQIFNYSDKELMDKLQAIEDISSDTIDYSDDDRFLNAIKTTYLQFLGEFQQVIRFYNSRKQDIKVELLVLNGRIFKINGIEEFVRGTLAIPVVKLDSSVDNSEDRYAAAIGGIIRRGDKKNE